MPDKRIKSLDAYARRVGAEELNFRRWMVKVHTGAYYTERALIKISGEGDITCSVKEYAPTEEEAAAIKEELSTVQFPTQIKAKNLAKCKVKDGFVFRDRSDNGIIMVQSRVEFEDGTKAYIPHTFWSDGVWRTMEPEGALPFWKPDEDRLTSRIMIHEGAKAAQAAADVPADHPWAEFLSRYNHWGMIGGALAPHRADYSEIMREKPVEVIYICDNDHNGKGALPKVSKAYGMPLKGVMFDKRWPGGWDIADDMPEGLFNSQRHYKGPMLEDMLRPATWATELLYPDGKGRPTTVISPRFTEEWCHSIRPDVYIHVDWPNRVYTPPEFNDLVAPYSHSSETSRLVKQDDSGKAGVIHYNPSMPPGIIGEDAQGAVLNTFVGTKYKPKEGDAAPFLDFLDHLVPRDDDRKELMRWCATIIARPDLKIHYGVLLISEMQGVGKGTLGEKIIAPLVGMHNVSFPGEAEIVDSNYNYWLAHKRFAMVHEIYAGHSAKAYNKLKSSITDRFITVQKKYMANYEVENWIHVMACSNSMRALRLENDDRRWFIPRIAEEKKTPEYWMKLNHWLEQEEGLEIVLRWAIQYLKEVRPVMPGDPAPWSTLKKAVVEEGYSPGQHVVAAYLEEWMEKVTSGDLPANSFLLDRDLVQLIKDTLYEGRHNEHLEKPLTVRKVAKAVGLLIGKSGSIKAWGAHAHKAVVMTMDPETAGTSQMGLFLRGREIDKAELAEIYRKNDRESYGKDGFGLPEKIVAEI